MTELFQIHRGAVEGPLATLIPVYLDVETYFNPGKGISLESMTLRQYLSKTYLTAMAVAIGDEEPMYFATKKGKLDKEATELVNLLRELAADPMYVFIAHNAAFDMRVLRFLLDIPHPVNVWCTMEGAMGAWPEFPGGFSLGNLSHTLPFPDNCKKREINLEEGHYSEDEMRLYNIADVLALRELYQQQIARLPACEQEVALMTHNVRKFHFEVNQERLENLMVELDAAAADAEQAVENMRWDNFASDEGENEGETRIASDGRLLTDDDIRNIFNREDPSNPGALKSIRSARLKNIIKLRFNATPNVTSYKKLAPAWQAKNVEATNVIREVSRANKMLSHSRRSKVLIGVDEVDVELGYMRAHTGRFSSPSQGKGLNLHNCISVRSLILTERGWVPILSLNKEDKLWDGVAFVEFAEVTYEGTRSTIKVGAAEITPEHPVVVLGQKKDAGSLTLCQQVQCVAGGLSSTLRGIVSAPCESLAMDAAKKLLENFRTSTKLLDAVDALIDDRRELDQTSSQRKISSSSARDSIICAIDVDTRATAQFRRLMVRSLPDQSSVQECFQNGNKTHTSISTTSKQFLDGTIEVLRLIESTICADTNREISDLLLTGITCVIDALLCGPKMANQSPTTPSGTACPTDGLTTYTDKAVFEVRGVGPRAIYIVDCTATGNCPKHEKLVAKPVRKTFNIPSDKCLVRGDLANVEYRVAGWLTDCPTVIKMFDETKGGSRFADPYIVSWKSMTNVSITKESPIRQVSKSAVLGLTFSMSPQGYAAVLMRVLADKSSGVTLKTLEQMIADLGWKADDSRTNYIIEKCGCSYPVAVASYNIHALFNNSHLELGQTAEFLVRAVSAVCASGQSVEKANIALDRLYRGESAPDRNKIDLIPEFDGLGAGLNLRVKCGPWVPTVCWRNIGMRYNKFQKDSASRLTIVKAGGLEKVFTKQLAIENVTQAAARNALCSGLLELKHKYGVNNVLHIHDEIMIICDRNRQAVLDARDQLTSVYGPKSTHPLDWAVLIKPSDISVTSSLWEEELDLLPPTEKNGFKGNDRWRKIEEGVEGCLDNLP